MPAARLADSRSMRRSPPEHGSPPAISAWTAAIQSIWARRVPPVMLVPIQMKRSVKSRASQVPWAMISPVAASSA